LEEPDEESKWSHIAITEKVDEVPFGGHAMSSATYLRKKRKKKMSSSIRDKVHVASLCFRGPTENGE